MAVCNLNTGFYLSFLSAQDADIYQQLLYAWEQKGFVCIQLCVTEIGVREQCTDRLLKIIECMLLDHPLIYNLDTTHIALNYSAENVRITISSLYSDEDRNIVSKKLDRIIERISESVHAYSSDIEKLNVIIPCLLNNTVYDTATADVSCKRMAHEVVGALLNGACTCAGCAKAFKLLCDVFDVDCIIVKGVLKSSPETPHMWNLTCVNGIWHHVDLASVLCSTREVRDFFFRSDPAFNMSHIWDHSLYPDCI